MPLIDNLKRFVLNHMVEGNLRFLGRPIYSVVIAHEVALLHMVDALCGPAYSADETLLQQLTAVVKTFERPNILKRLISSIKRTYPSLKIIVADDSRHPSQIRGVKVIRLPYDTGISFGRNEALKHVSTKYTLLLDDDFIFYRYTDLYTPLALMERRPEIDIMGGEVVDLPIFQIPDFTKVVLFKTGAAPTRPIAGKIEGLPVCDMVANFFIGRTDRVALVGWDPRLKRMDHKDFFTRAKGVLTTVNNADLKCIHARTPFNTAYMTKCGDTRMDLKVLKHKYPAEENPRG